MRACRSRRPQASRPTGVACPSGPGRWPGPACPAACRSPGESADPGTSVRGPRRCPAESKAACRHPATHGLQGRFPRFHADTRRRHVLGRFYITCKKHDNTTNVIVQYDVTRTPAKAPSPVPMQGGCLRIVQAPRQKWRGTDRTCGGLTGPRVRLSAAPWSSENSTKQQYLLFSRDRTPSDVTLMSQLTAITEVRAPA